MRELAVGQKVICKYKNGRYYHSELLELTTATFYEVVFDDGSYSDNLFPEDIEVNKMVLSIIQIKFCPYCGASRLSLLRQQLGSVIIYVDVFAEP